MAVDLSVQLGALGLKNPVLVAAGTYGYGSEFAEAVDLSLLGALVTKTVTAEPRQGNPTPRLAEMQAGMLNAVGLQNVGLKAFIAEKLPQLQALRVPVIVSVLGESPESLAAMVRTLSVEAGVAAIEVNLSCPNVSHGQPLRAGQVHVTAQDPEAVHAYLRAARQATPKPLLAKLSPDVADMVPSAQAAEAAGADALTLSNTYVGMSIDSHTQTSRIGMPTGGFSGPAIKPLGLYRVWYTAQHIRVPIIGLGGIKNAEDALEYILAGASAVSIGTANFANPQAPVKVLRGIERYMQQHNVSSLQALRGKLKASP